MCLKTLVLQARLVGGKELARNNFHSDCTVYLILHALPLFLTPCPLWTH
jgi:hypothetical protein